MFYTDLTFQGYIQSEHLNSHNSPFKFNAKELDPEIDHREIRRLLFINTKKRRQTGNYYYGARYYNPKWSLWLSVDPLAEVMPSWSPYVYTFNNPIRYTDPTGMIPENSGGGCPTPCDDPKIYPYTAGEQQLDPVVISTDKASNNSISFSGAMPDWMNRMEVGHYETSFKGDINDYNRRNGTNYSLGNGYMQWYYDNHYKRQYDELIADRNEAGKYVGYGFIGALAAPFALGALSTSGFSLLLNSGYKGFFARVSLDASIQYMITGDVNLIGATTSGFGFGNYGLMANAAGASADYYLFSGEFSHIYNSSKPLSHGVYDFLGSSASNLSRSIASPNNSLGPVGLEATGRIWGTLMSQKLKNQ